MLESGLQPSVANATSDSEYNERGQRKPIVQTVEGVRIVCMEFKTLLIYPQ